jgi:hypothetical protein
MAARVDAENSGGVISRAKTAAHYAVQPGRQQRRSNLLARAAGYRTSPLGHSTGLEFR